MKKKPDHFVSHSARELSAEERSELLATAALPDHTIDTSDIPETGPQDWSNAKVGHFYRPLKQQLTLRLDSSVVSWFKRRVPGGKGYQTDINKALRAYIEAEEKKAG